jgi:hypothetical protein
LPFPSSRGRNGFSQAETRVKTEGLHGQIPAQNAKLFANTRKFTAQFCTFSTNHGLLRMFFHKHARRS